MTPPTRIKMTRGRKRNPPVKPTPKLKTPRNGQFGHRSRAVDHLELAARGGRKAHQLGTAHEYTQEEAIEAGRKSSLMKRNDQEEAARRQRIAERLAAKGDVNDG